MVACFSAVANTWETHLVFSVFFGIVKKIISIKDMSFKKTHKHAYRVWVVVSVIIMVSMLVFLLAPLFLY